MEKKRKTELDIDLDLDVDALLDKKEEEKPPPPKPEEPEEPKEKGPGFLENLVEKFKQIPPKILIFTGAGILILILIAGIIAYFSMKPEPPSEVEDAAREKKEVVPFKVIPQYEFAPFFFPIKTKNNEEVFLKIAFSFDLSNEAVLGEIEQNIALLRANLSIAMKKKSLADIESNLDKTKLGQEILGILNRSLQKGTAVKVYFTQFLIN